MKYNAKIEKFVKKNLNLPYEGDEIDFKLLPENRFHVRRYSMTDLEAYIPESLNFKKGVLAKMMRNTQMQVVKNTSEKEIDLRNRLKHAVFSMLRAIEEKKRCSRRMREQRGLLIPFKNEITDRKDTIESMTRIRKLQTLEERRDHLSEVIDSRSLLSRLTL